VRYVNPFLAVASTDTSCCRFAFVMRKTQLAGDLPARLTDTN
jgi:hypothetical protein